MAVLGFILGLGFLIPVGVDEGRRPASTESENTEFAFTEPSNPSAASAPEDPSISAPAENESESEKTSSLLELPQDQTNHRGGILFDVHTIARHRSARDTDAWVQPWINKETGAFVSFLYCHNYDYRKGRPDTSLNRYAAYLSPNAFTCKRVTLEQLEAGHTLLDTPLGRILTLKTKNFDPKKGGTLSVIFAYRVATVSRIVGGENDYRAIDLIFRLRNPAIYGPGGEVFNWINLRMHETMGVPVGIDSVELYYGKKLKKVYNGKDFPRLASP
jgi:hypothetical protein